MLLARLDHPPRPVQQGGGVVQLGLDIDPLVPEDRVLNRRQVQLARRGDREARVAVGGPLHRGAHAVSVTEPDVVAHPDLVAVVEHRRAGQREEQGGEQLHPVDVVVEQRRQPAADADVGLHAGVLGVLVPHVVAVLVVDHLERQLVVVAQEDAPLAAVRDGRGLLEDLRDREPVLAAYGHEDARHHREVEAHVALVAGGEPLAGVGVALAAEVVDDVGGPLVGLRQQHPTGVVVVDVAAHRLEGLVGLGQVLAVGAGPLEEVGHRVEPEPVEAHVEPEAHRLEHRLEDLGVVVVEVGLVREEPVPVVLLPHRVPGPVGRLGVDEDDPCLLVELVGVGPHVEVAVGPVRVLAAGLEPRVLVAGVVHHEVDDHADVALVRLVEEVVEVLDGAGLGKDVGEVGDVVATVAQRRGEERRHPQAVDAQPVQVVELLGQSAEVADPVAVGVLEGTDEHLVEDRGLEPVGLLEVSRRRVAGGAGQYAALLAVVVGVGRAGRNHGCQAGLLTDSTCAGSW